MHHSQEVALTSNFQRKLFRLNPVLMAAAIFMMLAPSALAQRSFGASPGAGSGSSLSVNVVSQDGVLIDVPAAVTLSPVSGGSPLQQQSSEDGVAQFQSLKPGFYSVSIVLPGYKSGRQEVEVSQFGNAETNVVLESDDPPAAPGMILAPKAKKDIDDGIAALHASKYDEAQKQFEAAYKLAPGDPDVNGALGLLYIVKNDQPRAQEYISRALSLDPDNINALVDDGQLKLIQQDFKGAQPPLEKAVALAPHDYFSHWLLGVSYYGTVQYEKARVEALAAIKASKSGATDAEYLLGQALAGLGRDAEAVATLQKFVHEQPNGFYTPAAKSLVAKLQAGPPSNSAQTAAVPGGPVAQNDAASVSQAAH